MCDHRSIGLFLGNGLFSCGEYGFECSCLFLFYFCLVRGEKVASAQDFGWQSKGEDHFRSWFHFFLLFTWWQFCIVQILSGPKTFLYISSVFFRSLIGNFLSFLLSLNLWLGIFFFLFSPALLIGNFLSFLLSSEGKDWHSHSGSRFMVSWNFSSRLVERLDMTYVSFGQRFGGKGDVPHYFHDTHATMMVMHSPMWTLTHQIFMVMWY